MGILATALEFAAISGSVFGTALLHVRDEKSSGTAGGTSQTSFTKRDLNTTLTNEISGASLASSVITLPAGTYYIHASAPSYASSNHKLKLRNTTDSSDTIIGTNGYADSADAVQTMSFVTGRFTIAAQKNFELQHRTTVSTGGAGFGVLCGYSVVEVYTDVQIWKVA